MTFALPTGPLIDPRCNTCGEVVRWVHLPGGAAVPVDPEPDADGHMLLPFDDSRALPMSDEWRMEMMSDPDHAGRGKVYRDHRRTCGRLSHISVQLEVGSKRWAAREAIRQTKLEREARKDPPTALVLDARRRRVSKITRATVMARDGYRCVLCGYGSDLTLDHIFPFVEGGSDDAVNLRVLCRSCNSSKGASIPDQIRLLGRD